MPRARRTVPPALTALLALVLAWAPRAAEACSVCMGGREDENQAAFIATTVFLSVLPLALIGGIVFWLRRRLREIETARAAEPPAPGERRPEPRVVPAQVRAS